ncbi:fimbria/pilus periplasmic chaperone [Sphingomonas sp. KRR8]|uniref:fimbrial biogenesis chaperone n=1 Tax=Sphingomonas sp. KRR8 TaxID=2942996 RepID=UPI002020A7A4|nr:fimbria/pilus periplasmic chaperone [Sphingomonas sp. KRR8]URD60177.1 fimbria/pilus periplasmic chaperone [Sphingomonas sp. KRR8]
MIRRLIQTATMVAAAALAWPQAASAEIVLSQLVIDMVPGKPARGDIEVWNNDKDRAYVTVEPYEVTNPGAPTMERRTEPDPEKLGLLVTPARMILEPGQRKLLRISAIGALPARERVFRVTVKPTVGTIQTNVSGLKLLIGYDVLVLLRPAGALVPKLASRRSGDKLVIRNEGTVSVELAAGKACRAKNQCQELPGKRLYAGAEWTVDAAAGTAVDYAVVTAGTTTHQTF